MANWQNIASGTFNRFGMEWQLIIQEDTTDVITLQTLGINPYSLRLQQGNFQKALYKEYLPTTLDFNIIDNFYLTNRFKGKSDNKFKVKLFYVSGTITISVYDGFLALDQQSYFYWKLKTQLSLRSYDGVSILQTKIYDESLEGQPLGTMIHNILQNIETGFTYFLFDWKHINASAYSSFLPDEIMVYPTDVLYGINNPTFYDLLIKVLGKYNLQLFKNGNGFYVLHRKERNVATGSINLYSINSSGARGTTTYFQNLISINTPTIQSKAFEFPALPSYSRTYNFTNKLKSLLDPYFFSGKGYWNGNFTGTGPITLDYTGYYAEQDSSILINHEDSTKLQIVGLYQAGTGIPDGSYTYDYAEIKLVNASIPGIDYWVKEDGSLSSSQYFWHDDYTASGGSADNTSKPFDITVSIIPPDYNSYRLSVKLIRNGTFADFITLARFDSCHGDFTVNSKQTTKKYYNAESGAASSIQAQNDEFYYGDEDDYTVNRVSYFTIDSWVTKSPTYDWDGTTSGNQQEDSLAALERVSARPISRKGLDLYVTSKEAVTGYNDGIKICIIRAFQFDMGDGDGLLPYIPIGIDLSFGVNGTCRIFACEYKYDDTLVTVTENYE